MNLPARTVSLAATGAAALASALAYPFLPERVATHFDAEGQPDRFGSRTSAALTLPALDGAILIANDLLGSWPGGADRENSESGKGARARAVELTVLSLLPAHLGILARGLGVPIDMSRLSRAVTGVAMIALGNVLPTLPRNGLIGIRTPWTLADPAIWERTHRLGGYLCTAAGLVSMASLPLTGKRSSRIPTVATLTAVGLSALYSFVAYRQAHTRR